MLDFRLDSGEWRRQAPWVAQRHVSCGARLARHPSARAIDVASRAHGFSRRAERGSRREAPRGEADAADLFKRGGQGRRVGGPEGGRRGTTGGATAEGAGDDGSRARRPRADADAEDGDGAPGSAGVCPGKSPRARGLADGGSLRSRPRLLAVPRRRYVVGARRLSAHADFARPWRCGARSWASRRCFARGAST